MIFSFFNKKPTAFFNERERQDITNAVAMAEKRTSGEVRVFIENRCRYVDALDRAAEVFWNLKMQNTASRNGVLIYVALKDRQMAVFGDDGIHNKVGTVFWMDQVKIMMNHFNSENIALGIINVIHDVGEALYIHFPYDNETDKNELPDDIVFGK